MNVLGTKFSTAMGARNGWFSINEVLDDTFKHYTFNQCLKLKVPAEERENFGFVQWVMYWEDSPVAVLLHVLTTVLPTGYVKVSVLSKEHKFIDEIGEYPSKQAVMDGFYVDGKFLDRKGLDAHYLNKLKNGEYKKVPDAILQAKKR